MVDILAEYRYSFTLQKQNKRNEYIEIETKTYKQVSDKTSTNQSIPNTKLYPKRKNNKYKKDTRKHNIYKINKRQTNAKSSKKSKRKTGKGKGKRERGRGKEKGMGKGQGKGKGKEEGEGEREWERERDKNRERGIPVLCRQKRIPENKKYMAERSPFF